VTARVPVPADLPPYVEWYRPDDDYEVVELQGLVHVLRASPTGDPTAPVVLEIESPHGHVTARLDDEQVSVLRRFLESYDDAPLA
jgi:hypothetical protein